MDIQIWKNMIYNEECFIKDNYKNENYIGEIEDSLKRIHLIKQIILIDLKIKELKSPRYKFNRCN